MEYDNKYGKTFDDIMKEGFKVGSDSHTQESQDNTQTWKNVEQAINGTLEMELPPYQHNIQIQKDQKNTQTWKNVEQAIKALGITIRKK